MYKHILIPTDGSALSNKAIQQGIALAKAVSAKITGITVTIPFHVFALDPETIEDTADSYKKRTTAQAAKYLKQVNDAAAAAGVSCSVIHVEHEHPYRAIIDAANKNGCESDSNGFAWPARDLGRGAWQRDLKGSDAQQHSRFSLSIVSAPLSFQNLGPALASADYRHCSALYGLGEVDLSEGGYNGCRWDRWRFA